ncbi:MAG: fibronectin type III-like domain-contianing protein, partial [Candidatus Bathyarchaeia archaeon]
GEEGGNAIAEVLFGDYNPGGKLPITFPKTVGQLPLYYNPKPSGRVYDYVDLRGTQYLFPFGYGLSYTRFEYSNLRIDPEKISPNGSVRVQVDVKNVGGRRGDEVVQLYIHDQIASVARPIKELKGFKRITLEPGEQKTVTFTLGPEELSFYDINMDLVVEPGLFEVMVGSSSEDIRLKGAFEVA